MEQGFDDLVPRLAPDRRRIVLFGDVPKWTLYDPKPCVFAEIGLPRRSCGAAIPFVSEATLMMRAGAAAHKVLEKSATRNHAVAYLPEQFLCKNGKCQVFVADEFLYRDGDHFRRNLKPSTVEKTAELLELDGLFSVPEGATGGWPRSSAPLEMGHANE
jgi:hypothetical protein